MNQVFRTNVQELSNELIATIKPALMGDGKITDRIKEAIRFINTGVKVEHMNQIREQHQQSVALRLIKYLPRDIDRDEYVRATNPMLGQLKLKSRAKAIVGK